MQQSGGQSGDSASKGATPVVPPAADPLDDRVVERVVQGLSNASADALEKAASEGIPDPHEVAEWAGRLRQIILHPGDTSGLRSAVPTLGERLRRLLGGVELPGGATPTDTTEAFLARLPEVRGHLAEDVEAAFEGDPAAKSYAEIVAAYPALRAIATYRFAHELQLLGVPLLPRIMTEDAHSQTGIDIHPGAKIGRRFFIDHGTGVVIGETCEIGDRVVIYQGVTLGALAPRKGQVLRGVKRHPTIEDEVTIYAGATILGGETVIGRGSVIGGNVWITSSIPACSKVLIEPPRLQLRRDPNCEDRPGETEEFTVGTEQLNWDI